MTTFPDLARYEDETTNQPLVLPINGKQYRFSSSLPMGRGIQLTRMREEAERLRKPVRDAFAALREELGRGPTLDEVYAHLRESGHDPTTGLDLDDGSEIDLYLDLIGAEQRARMEADGITYDQLIHVGSTLFTWHIAGEEAALRVWTRGKMLDGDVRPPAERSARSARPRTSPNSSTKKPRTNSNSRGKATRSRGATTTSAGD